MDTQSWNGYGYVGNNPLSYTDPSGMFLEATTAGASAGGPPGAVIGAAIDIFAALFGFGIFGGGGSPVQILPGTQMSSTLQPSPSADWQGSNEQVPDGTDSDGLYDPGSLWNERLPRGGAGGVPGLGGVFGGGSTGPFVFSAVDPNSVELHHIFSQAEEFAPFWRAAKIEIDNYLISIPAGVHRLKSFGGIHTGSDNWNAAWRAFLRSIRPQTDSRSSNRRGG
jgi:hypothetical protein